MGIEERIGQNRETGREREVYERNEERNIVVIGCHFSKVSKARSL